MTPTQPDRSYENGRTVAWRIFTLPRGRPPALRRGRSPSQGLLNSSEKSTSPGDLSVATHAGCCCYQSKTIGSSQPRDSDVHGEGRRRTSADLGWQYRRSLLALCPPLTAHSHQSRSIYVPERERCTRSDMRYGPRDEDEPLASWSTHSCGLGVYRRD